MKIAVYAICKNEEKFIERFCKSAADADLIVIADTGSNDNTISIAKDYGAVIHNISISPWRFDKARDTALALVPSDYDICVSLDIDEVLEPGWREEVERVWSKNTTILEYMYEWAPGIIFPYIKIHSRHGYFWNGPCHEIPKADPRLTEVYAYTDKVLVTHLPDLSKDRSQYLSLSRVAKIEDNFGSPFGLYLCGWEFTRHKQWKEAIDAFMYYLITYKQACRFERSRVMQLLAKCHEELGNEAEHWYIFATKEAPDAREPWCELAKYYLKVENYSAAYNAAITALTITVRERNHTINPNAWAEVPHHCAALASWHLGKLYDALKHCEDAVREAPDKKYIQDDLSKIKSQIG